MLKAKARLFCALVAIFVSVGALLPVIAEQRVSAVSASSWRAGRIIDDGIFTNANDMSVSDIQSFLNAQVPNCDTNGTQPASEYGRPDLTHAQYAASRGWSAPPYVCLRNFYEVPKTAPSPGIPDNSYSHGGGAFSGGISAAQMIYNAAQQYQINPKVLLVKLRTESAGPLTNDPWPLANQYTYAMGAHCPDSGPGGSASCDSNYAGFSIQIAESAALLRWYINSMGQPWWQYKKPYQTNSILWNVAPSGCGSSDVYIESKATAALYTYTPYQPNASALANLYGTGDGCSAYGNRNFWRVYNDWFGSTYNPDLSWALESQQVYANTARTRTIDPTVVSPGQIIYVRIVVRNTGNFTWWNSGSMPMNLGTSNPSDRTSMACDSTWLSCTRPTRLSEASVTPGQTGTFEFQMRAPTTYGMYNEYFRPVIDGLSWLNDIGMYLPIGVKPPTDNWSYLGQNLYLDSGRTQPANTTALAPNRTYYAQLSVRNTGNTLWTNSGEKPINLATTHAPDRNSPFCDSSWLSCNRPTNLKETSVAPGEVGTFEFQFKTPSSLSSYNEYFNLVREGAGWLPDKGLNWSLGVRAPVALWQSAGQTVYTDDSKVQKADTSSVNNAGRLFVVLRAKNIGNTTWTNSGVTPVNLATTLPGDRISSFCDSTWLSCNRPARLLEPTVAPGETGTFEFWMKAPYATNGTTYREYFRPVVEGSMWMNDIGMYIDINMQSSITAWQYVSQAAYANSALTTAVNLTSSATNTTYYLQLKAKNTGGTIWKNSGATPTNLGTSNPTDRISVFCDSSWLHCTRPTTLKEASVAPGQIGTFEFKIKTPATSGTYNEYFRPVTEGINWLTDVGQYWTIVTR